METVQTSVNIITLYPIAFCCVRCAFFLRVEEWWWRRWKERSGENQFNCVMFSAVVCITYIQLFRTSNSPRKVFSTRDDALSRRSKGEEKISPACVCVCARGKKAAEKSPSRRENIRRGRVYAFLNAFFLSHSPHRHRSRTCWCSS
jgi:hypothetical protein